MKKLLIIAFIFAGINGFGQVTKVDFENLIAAFPPSGYEYVYLSNVRGYMGDGSNKLDQRQYYANQMNIEPKEQNVYLRFFKDSTKVLLTDIMVIPYTSIIRIEAYDKGFIIDLMQ